MTHRREYGCIVGLWNFPLHMIVGTIERLQVLIHPWLVGVPQSYKAHECLEDVVHLMTLVEEQGIIDECFYLPIKIILQP